ncbi:hypothetical protein [Rhizobium sp. BK376]|jgi:hypothetical protein|uniref:hypothetical protein n=1 Tax=Rhizobium sp. BK376 TaxID=2512149 RepID=UPI00104591C2|nr:hypothetical protein [Rhizobium sp. BK376]
MKQPRHCVVVAVSALSGDGMSIYKFTKRKLISHGVLYFETGKTILDDKQLFLLFVKLERARRLADLCIIQSKIEEIAAYTKKVDKFYLILFAYMYIRFSDFTPHIEHAEVRLDNGDVRYIKDYRCPLSQPEIAIGEWALSMYEKYERHFFRAMNLRDQRVKSLG